LSVTRGGDSGASLTVNGIPTELTIRVTIQDMYAQLMASNEYDGAGTGVIWGLTTGILTKLLTGSTSIAAGAGLVTGTLTEFSAMKRAVALTLNNIGLIDFVASYSGYNLNTADSDIKLSYVYNTFKNRLKDIVELDNPWSLYSPVFSRKVTDSYSNLVAQSQTFIST